MSAAKTIHECCTRIERVAKQDIWDAPAREVIRSNVKQLMRIDSSTAGDFVAKLLHGSLGPQAAQAAYQTVRMGVFVGDDVANSSIADFCLASGSVKALRAVVEAGPPPVAIESTKAQDKASWLTLLSSTRFSAMPDKELHHQGVAMSALFTPALAPETVQAALELSWDMDPEHLELTKLCQVEGPQGAKAREFVMQKRLAATATAPAAPAPTRARSRVL